MRALLAASALLLALLPLPAASALAGCQGPVCADVDSFSGDCDSFYLEFARLIAPGVVVYAGRWCGSDFGGARADVVASTPAGVVYVGGVWYHAFGSCDTLVFAFTPAGTYNEGLGCPAGSPPDAPPVIMLLG